MRLSLQRGRSASQLPKKLPRHSCLRYEATQEARYLDATSPMNTPNAGRVTSGPFAPAPGVATSGSKLAGEAPCAPRWKLAFCADPDMFSATSTEFPL